MNVDRTPVEWARLTRLSSTHAGSEAMADDIMAAIAAARQDERAKIIEHLRAEAEDYSSNGMPHLALNFVADGLERRGPLRSRA